MRSVQLEIRCSTHGLMRFRMESYQWVCPGFDGEGCPLYLTYEEAEDIGAGRPIDRVTADRFSWKSLREPGGSIEILLMGEP